MASGYGWPRRQPKGAGWEMIKGAARLLKLNPAPFEGVILVLVDQAGRPTVGHNAASREEVPAILRAVAVSYEQQIAREQADG